MTDNEIKRRKAICDAAGVDEIGKLSDGFHTFNSLYEQRMILFAALVKVYKNQAWKSYRHEDGEYCFGGGWFIVGIDTPEGSYTYHYENKYWNMFECVDLPRAKHWDGHTEEDAETRLMSLEPQRWVPVTERLPEKDGEYLVACFTAKGKPYAYGIDTFANDLYQGIDAIANVLCQVDEYDFSDKKGKRGWMYFHDEYGDIEDKTVVAWMPLPAPYREEGEK